MVNDSELEKLILILQKLAHFVNQEYYFFTYCTFSQGNEEIADVFLCEVSQKVTVDVAEICDVLFQECEGVDEEENVG